MNRKIVYFLLICVGMTWMGEGCSKAVSIETEPKRETTIVEKENIDADSQDKSSEIISQDESQDNAVDNSTDNPTTKESKLAFPLMDHEKYLSIHTLPDVEMEWKYKNEKEFILDKDKTLDDLDEFMDSYKGRQHIHIKMIAPSILSGASEILADYCSRITTLELVVESGFLADKGKNVKIKAPPKCDTRIILTGIGKLPVTYSGARFDISADTVVMRHFQFTDSYSNRVIHAEIGSLFIGEDLLFNHNHIIRDRPQNRRKKTGSWVIDGEPIQPNRVNETLIGFKALTKSGKVLSYRLNNVAFIDNDVKGLVMIDRNSLDRFDNLELNHVTVRDNLIGEDYGVDISASRHAVVRDSIIINNSGLTVLYHCLPKTEVKVMDSKVQDDGHAYVPCNSIFNN